MTNLNNFFANQDPENISCDSGNVSELIEIPENENCTIYCFVDSEDESNESENENKDEDKDENENESGDSNEIDVNVNSQINIVAETNDETNEIGTINSQIVYQP